MYNSLRFHELFKPIASHSLCYAELDDIGVLALVGILNLIKRLQNLE